MMKIGLKESDIDYGVGVQECVDIVFENDTRRAVPVQGDSEIAFMQDILKRLH